VSYPNVCDRCSGPLPVSTMSRFNTEMCCMACIDKERAHPKYKEAEEVEIRQVRAGNYNYHGIGKPADL